MRDSESSLDLGYDFPLISRTAIGWAEVALADFGTFLQDHAQCERKAAASCLSYVSKYPNITMLVDPMISLAREELEHFAQVFRLLQKRSLPLVIAEKDPYVNELIIHVRTGPEERLLDRLVVSSLIEARSCERLQLVAAHLQDLELADFYHTLARSEAGHYRVFLRLAERLFPKAEVHAAMQRLSLAEDKAMKGAPWRSAVH
jgi:tRNA-(ms[2]io[6]A)-hydroxylase